MYIGSTCARGAAHLLFELVSNSLAEYSSGFASRIDVKVDRTGIMLSDDGRGIPVDGHSGVLQKACTSIDTSDPDRFHPEIHVTTFGLGLGVVSALSSVMVVTIDRTRRYQQVFSRGCAVTSLLDIGPAIGRGTTVYAVPDTEIFGEADPSAIGFARLEELAVLNPGVSFTWNGRGIPSFGGVAGFARHLAQADDDAPRLVVDVTQGDVRIQAVAVWGEREPSDTRGYVNQLLSTGSHVNGLLKGLAGTRENGRVALVAVQVPVARFDGRTRRVYQNPAISLAVRRAVEEARQQISPALPIPRSK
jgi:DNA gyrase subunit B